MKTIIVIPLLFLISRAHAGFDSVFVKIAGDTVQIWNTRTEVVCESHFLLAVTVLVATAGPPSKEHYRS